MMTSIKGAQFLIVSPGDDHAPGPEVVACDCLTDLVQRLTAWSVMGIKLECLVWMRHGRTWSPLTWDGERARNQALHEKRLAAIARKYKMQVPAASVTAQSLAARVAASRDLVHDAVSSSQSH